MLTNTQRPLTGNEGTASYCPDDNKIRLYVGRVPRDEYDKLRAEGWTATPKQNCQFSAVWTPARRDTALAYAGFIEDEDMDPAERAADRAERFSGYRDKRTSEAEDHADHYEAGPSAHGFQNQARAERAAERHNRIADKATDQWSKAEYWTHRTAGVISHALYISTPEVRMGRIKVLEAELRKHEAEVENRSKRFRGWQKIAAMTDAAEQTRIAIGFAGAHDHYWCKYLHPITGNEMSLYSLLTNEENPITGAQACELFLSNHKEPAADNDWSLHYKHRLAYENQMLEAQGGRAAHVEMVPGGFIGERQIWKVNKSSATGRVVSVHVKTEKVQGYVYRSHNVAGAGFSLTQIETERLPANAYRAPTPEELATFEEEQKTTKATIASKKIDCPLINPIDADAERLQLIWDKEDREPSQVLRLTQAEYSARSSGSCSSYETVIVSEFGTRKRCGPRRDSQRCQVFKIRKAYGGGFNNADRVIIITDKPQKPIPWDKIESARASQPSVDTMRDKLPEIETEVRKAWITDANKQLLYDADYVGWLRIQSMSQISWTDTGCSALAAYKQELVAA